MRGKAPGFRCCAGVSGWLSQRAGGGGSGYTVRMFEGGVLPRVPVGGAVGTLSAPAGDVSAGAVGCVEDVVGLLGSLAAGGELAGVVEGLLARLLVAAQNPNDDGDGDGGDVGGEGSDAESAGSADGEGLFAGDSDADATLVAAADGHRVVSLEEVGATGLLGLGARGLGELAAACHRLAAWAAWGESLAAACLTACGELSSHPGQWGPDGRVSSVVGFEERRFNTTCLLSARLGVSRSRVGQIVDHGSALMDMGFNPTEVMERCGVLDAAKASLVTRRLGDVPAPVALAVQERVLPQAPRRSVSQVGRDIERALMETDPTGHAERVRANQERRCVSRPKPAGEGMSQVRLLLPTMDALLLDATLDAIAASARACGERRTPAQLRADAITAMTLSTLRTSQQTAYHRPTQAPDDDTSGGTGGGGGLGSSTGDFGGVSELGSVPASFSPPRRSASLGRLLPDGVPLEGLLGALSSLVGSASPWWTPSGTGHLPLPAGIHIDVQVTVPLTSLTDPGGLAQPEDATDSGDPGGGECFKEPRNLKSSGAPPGQIAAITSEACNDAASLNSRRGLSTAGGRSLSGSSGRSLPEPTPAAPTASLSTAPVSQTAASRSAAPNAQPAVQPAVSLPAAATGVAQVRVGVRSVAVPALTAWALAAGGTWRRLVTDPASGSRDRRGTHQVPSPGRSGRPGARPRPSLRLPHLPDPRLPVRHRPPHRLEPGRNHQPGQPRHPVRGPPPPQAHPRMGPHPRPGRRDPVLAHPRQDRLPAPPQRHHHPPAPQDRPPPAPRPRRRRTSRPEQADQPRHPQPPQPGP